MSTVAELEERIQELEDIEAIRRLKYEYWDSVDSKDWERYGNVFTEEFVWHFPPSPPTVMTRQKIIDTVSAFLLPHVKSCHQGHQHFIEINGATTAKGSWCFRDDLVSTKTNTEFKGRGCYDEEYLKVDGKWQISKIP